MPGGSRALAPLASPHRSGPAVNQQSPMLPLLATAAFIAAGLVLRYATGYRLELETATRLRTGADGIIPGAGTIDLGPPPGTRPRGAALLLHGFGDTPQTLDYLANDLNARGYAVRAPLLPGHGRTLRAFAASDGDAWVAAARAELGAMRERYGSVSLVGLSMGGAIASILAAESPAPPALVLLAPYLDMPPHVRRFARYHGVVGMGVTYLRGGSLRSIHDDAERARNLAYRATTPRLLAELARIAERGRDALPRITAPTLIVQSREDNRISPAVAERAHALLGSREKLLVWTAGNGHVITVDFGRERVFEETAGWLERFAVRDAGHKKQGTA